MKQFFVRTVQLFLFLVLLFGGCHSAPSKAPRRPSIVGLLPALRAARPGGYQWELDPAEIHDATKRFPKFLRTGRSGSGSLFADDDLNKNNGNILTTGMWFGPRLGRVQKRNSELQENPCAYVIFAGENSIPRQLHFGKDAGELSSSFEDEDLGQEIRSA